MVQWTSAFSYCASKLKIGAVNALNEYAERGVELSADFSGTAKMADHFQNILQGVECDRKKKSNLKKQKYTNYIKSFGLAYTISYSIVLTTSCSFLQTLHSVHYVGDNVSANLPKPQAKLSIQYIASFALFVKQNVNF